MQIEDFNQPSAPQEPANGQAPAGPGSGAGQAQSAGRKADEQAAEQEGPRTDDRAAIEIALLTAQVEHLELVVETARSLMTSNQERLLRRLHDLPREMAALAAQLDRFDPPGGRPAPDRARPSIRRVA